MLEKLLSQTCAVEMNIKFGGSDGFMPQHLLNGPQVCSPFKKMGGK